MLENAIKTGKFAPKRAPGRDLKTCSFFKVIITFFILNQC